MAIKSLFLEFQCLQILAEAANASSRLSSLVESPRNPLHERSTGFYGAVLGANSMVADGWPGIEQWIDSFEVVFEKNKGVMFASCSQWGLPNNSEDETNSINDAIYQGGKSSVHLVDSHARKQMVRPCGDHRQRCDQSETNTKP